MAEPRWVELPIQELMEIAENGVSPRRFQVMLPDWLSATGKADWCDGVTLEREGKYFKAGLSGKWELRIPPVLSTQFFTLSKDTRVRIAF